MIEAFFIAIIALMFLLLIVGYIGAAWLLVLLLKHIKTFKDR